MVSPRPVLPSNERAASRLGSSNLNFIVLAMDTLKEKALEATLQRLNRSLQTLHQCNLALIRANDEHELLQSICRILVEFGGMRMTWVGYREDDPNKSVLPAVHAGFENGYLREVQATWADNERGQGPTGTAIRTGKPVWIKNIEVAATFAPWRKSALERHYASCLTLPLLFSGEVLGALTLYSGEVDTFNEETFAQHVELADNLAYRIAALRDRQKRRETDEALRLSEAYLAEGQRLTHTGSWAWDAVRQENLYWSKEHFRIFGFDPDKDALSYTAALERIHPDDKARFAHVVQKAVGDRQDFELEFRVTLPDGSVHYVHSIGHPVLDDAGDVAKMVGTAVDVTQQKLAESLLAGERRTLEMIAGGVPLKDVLQELCDVVDEQSPLLLSAVLLLDPDGKRLWPAAGRRVPEGWTLAISPLEIGPSVGSCGTAAFLKDQVIVSDIANDPLWAPYKEKALGYGLRACWSRPLLSRNHEVLGTFAVYYTEPHAPRAADLALIERAAHVAVIAIERERSQAVLRQAFDEIKVLKDRLFEENLALREEVDQASMFEEIIGTSPALRDVLSRVAKVAPSDSTVLITGETGTGKELIARAIHKRSPRSSRAFVSVNCAAIPSSLIASELFGHEKGAFTGALQKRIGRFELAEGGTIFLDEIGELPPETQVALLRVLQEREFERIGGNRAIPANVRVIAATNRDLESAVANGQFRADLFYRLNVFPIELPPLRNRKEDIRLLVAYFVERYADKLGRRMESIDRKTLELFNSYPWPGNIRELQNVVERSLILCERGVFSVDENWLRATVAPASEPAAPLTEKLNHQEKELIEKALALSRGRVAGATGAAAKLGIPPSTLESRIRTLRINKGRFRQA